MAANVGKLAGRTVFITGASRGIGKAIAIKAARDGANVVIAAKTAEPHPKLPGTIYTAAKEVEDAGGRCLPCIVDIQHESQVRKAVEEAVHTFGGIDILINNASAISLTGTLDTPMKRYDLMMGVNGRGTYLCSQVCLPYLKDGRNPHILNISPPLNLNPKWFKNHVAYTMAKYGMSMCALGMSEELRDDGIAVNALWPRTGIYTAAMEMLGGGSEVAKSCRTPDIMADAAYVMLTKDSRTFTGNFCIDDNVLLESGVTDLDQYACVKGGTLIPDFFLDDVDPNQVGETVLAAGGTPKYGASAAAEAPSGEVGNIFKTLKGLMSEDLVKSVNGVYAFELSGSEEGSWFLDLKNNEGAAGMGSPEVKANCTFNMDSADFVKMFQGELKPTTAFMLGKMKIKGDMGLAMKLEKLMVQMRDAKPAAPAAEATKTTAAPSGEVAGVFNTISGMLSEDLVKSINGVYAFELSGNEEGKWFLDLKNDQGSLGEGAPEGKANCTFNMDSADFVKMFQGELKPTTAFMLGKMKIKGDMGLAMKLEKLMGQMRKSKL